MTDPGAADRLAALRPRPGATQTPHAQAAKIATAGISASLVLGIIAYLGHSATQQEAAEARAFQRLTLSEDLAAVIARPVMLAVPSTPQSITTQPVTTQPITTQPATTQAGQPAAPPVIVVAVPAPAPAPAPRPTATHSSTRSSSSGTTTKTSH
jgi:hypothetical protein